MSVPAVVFEVATLIVVAVVETAAEAAFVSVVEFAVAAGVVLWAMSSRFVSVVYLQLAEV